MPEKIVSDPTQDKTLKTEKKEKPVRADEPAEKLLGRIKEERVRQMTKEGTNKIKTSKETLKEVGLMRYV